MASSESLNPARPRARLRRMRVIGGRWLAVTACAALLTACSSVRPWLNTAMQADQLRSMHVNETRDPSLVMAVTISGGGARAARRGTSNSWHTR